MNDLVTSRRRYQFWSSLILCTSSLAALDGLLERVEHFRHDDHALPTWLRTVLVLFLIPLASGFLSATLGVDKNRGARWLPLCLAPFLLTAIKLILDDASADWMEREGWALAALACVASVFAGLGGLLRHKAEGHKADQ